MMRIFDEMAADYVTWANKLSQQISSYLSKYRQLAEGAGGYGNSVTAIKATLDAFSTYRTDAKPQLKSSLSELQDCLHNLHADQVG
jgi:hypothetical protein